MDRFIYLHKELNLGWMSESARHSVSSILFKINQYYNCVSVFFNLNT